MDLPIEPDTEPLAGTVKPYEHHLALCAGGPPELWAARVEEMDGLVGTLHRALLRRGLERRVKLTLCDEVTLSEQGFDLYLMPEMLRLPGITGARVDPLVETLAAAEFRGFPFEVAPMAGGDHLFVCTHANRDERCGTWGPPLYAALAREIEAQGAIAHLHRSSHIGGHRFAATCIVYPSGIWYGELRPEDADRLVRDHLIGEQLLPDRYRGRLGASPCRQVAEAVAARALLAITPSYETLEVEVDERDGSATAVAHARILTPDGFQRLSATFRLSCPLVWWDADEEPVYVGGDQGQA